ncbi:ATP-dependent RNA helicase [Hamiltosporidium tvaerminnensis]|uniref:ATP-dependent RNA helicase n=1 Tax=Hamiltosporidium tvaerminnensis TaxID=1176355 RepID=A0A4Q9LWV3_9MICR|nr:ATP-dependent RNA helicase [Hamiltosporidium tvaerminnensis]
MENILLKGIKQNTKAEKIERIQRYEITGKKLEEIKSFELLNIELQNKLNKSGFIKPLLIQRLVIPYFINKRSIIVNSHTGSGKTLAFLIPILHLKKKSLILVPNSILQEQICSVIEMIKDENLNILKIKNSKDLKSIDNKRYDIIVSTPEILFETENIILLKNIRYLIIDEADLIFSKNNLKNLEKLFSLIDLKKVCLSVFSATINKIVTEISCVFDVTKISVFSLNAINHEFLFCTTNSLKQISLKTRVDEGIPFPCLIFVKKEETAVELSKRFEKSAVFFKNDQKVLDDFRLKKIWILFCSDRLSRGMDFYNVKSVINYNFPKSKTNFIHRIGRVNRNNFCDQKVITLFTKEDFLKLDRVITVLKENKSEIPESVINIATKAKNKK